MKQIYFLAMLCISAFSFAQTAVITSYVDATCSGATPRTLEIYVEGTVDFTGWKIVKQTNGNGFAPGSSSRSEIDLDVLGTISNDFIYATNDAAGLTREFGITANVIENGNINSNGDDAFQIIDNNDTVIDRFGEDGVQASSGVAWRHADTYVYRFDGIPANGGAFNVGDFLIGALDLLDGQGDCDGTNSANALSNIVPLGSYSTVASTTPEIIVSGAVTGLDYFEGDGPSDEGTITVSGRNLTTDLSISSTTFEISETSGGTFTTSLALQQQGGDVAATTLYVRLAAGQSIGTYTETVDFTSGSAPAQSVSVEGTVAPATPEVFISGAATGMNYNEGNGPSNEDSFAVSGRFLTGTDITVSVTAPFELSLTTGGTFSSQVSVPLTAGAADFVDVFVRLSAGQPEGTYSSTVTASATGASDDTITVNGEVFAAASCANVGDIIFTEIMQNPSNNSDPSGEYFELYNTTNSPIDIQSWIISDDVSASETHTITASLIVPANGYIVIGNGNAGANPGDATLDYDYANDISLGNGTDGLILSCGSTIIDQVIWDNGATFPDPSGASMELATNRYSATLNDVGENWGVATNDFGAGDFGTPGTVNNFLSNVSLNKATFKMYPNPANGNTLFIESSNGASMDVAIYSTLGQRVIKKNDISTSMNISSLETGIYIVQITQGANVQTRKLIVE